MVVTVLIAVLGVSIVAMTLLLAVKRYELNTGRVFMSGARPAASTFFQTIGLIVGKALPRLIREFTYRLARYARSLLERLTARVVFTVEHTLERVLHTMREKTEAPRAEGEVSTFLREVADHKKKLSKRVRRSIFDN